MKKSNRMETGTMQGCVGWILTSCMALSTLYLKDYGTILQLSCRICSVNGRLWVSGSWGGCRSSGFGFIGVMSDMGVLGLRLRE